MLIALTCLQLLSLCSYAQEASPERLVTDQVRGATLYEPLYDESGITRRELLGPWSIEGYGFCVLLEERGLRAFSVTSKGAWELAEDGFMSSGDLFLAIGDTGDQRRLAMHPLETPYTIARLDRLPAACMETVEWTPTKIFDVYCALMVERYPFFEVRGFDWAQRQAAAAELVHDGMSERQLLEVIAGTLEGLGDGHVSLEAETEGRKYTFGFDESFIASRIDQELAPDLKGAQRTRKKNQRLNEVYRSISEGVQEEVLLGEAHHTADNFLWGRVGAEIGYIAIEGMGFDEGMGLSDQVALLHSSFDEMLRSLEGVQAIVLDCSFNGGGMDIISHAIASHFIDEARRPYSKGPALRPEISHEITIEPWGGQRFTGPVFLVSSDLTASAAEVFQLCLKDEPHVTLVGTRGAKIFSDIVPKTLPNGWNLGLSIEAYRDAAGICYEGIGVPVDVELPIFEGEDLKTTHYQAIIRLMDLVIESI